MKLLALRVQQFRRFAEPVAIEDIGDGVNVLAGPNEMGKSTLFHALEAAFLLKHRTSGAVLEAMRPRSGGEPMVEVDFLAHGKRWRLRKQFGRGSSAQLTDLESGRIESRAGDAEDRMIALSGRKDDQLGRLGLVWVRQQRSLVAADPDLGKTRGERQALIDAIGHEVESAAGGETFDAVQRLVEAARETYVTSSRSAVKKNSPLDLARRTRDDIKAALSEAERAADAAHVRLAKIASLSAELAELTTAAQRAAPDRTAALEARITQAAQLRAERDVARQALRTAQSEAVAARQSLDAHDEAVRRRAALREAKAAAEALEAEIKDLAAKLNTDAATPARMAELVKLESEAALAGATVSAEAAVVDIALAGGHENRVRAGGGMVGEDRRITVADALDISIDGIAAIRVTAGGGARAKSALIKRDKALAGIEALLTALALATVDEAKARGVARAAMVDDLDRARAKLSGLAPKGSAGIAVELAKFDAPAGQDEPSSALHTQLRAAEVAVTSARSALEKLEADALPDDAFRALSGDLQRLKDETARRTADITRLSTALDYLKGEQSGVDEDGRAGRVDGLQGQFDRAGAEVKRLEAEVAALTLLSSTLARIEAQARDKYFEPVSRRLSPHLETLFGSARAGFRDTFSLDTLTRDGEAEHIDTLSDGTREQLSVLVRLSFAELLESRGEGAPLILDDPLVYSDDARLDAMCRILGEAGGRVQVLLLTCRAGAFKNLPGRRLSVTPWRPGI